MRNSLSRYFLLIKRWAWVILLGVIICSAATYVITKFIIPPTYQASAEFSFRVTSQQSSQNDTVLAGLALLPTFNQMMTSPQVLDPVARNHGGLSTKQLAAMVSVKQQSTSLVMDIVVTNRDPQLAAQLANERAQSFQQNYIIPVYEANITSQISSADIPQTPDAPKPTSDAILAALVGLGLSLTIVVLFEWIDDRLRMPDEIQSLLALDLLAVIPELSARDRSKNAEETPELAEACRILCANLNMAQMLRPFKLVMVTSALPGEGKSTIAANIASFLAMSGKRVLLVDGDLRHPVLDQHFQIENRHGLSNAFLDVWKNNAEMVLDGHPTEIPSLRVLTAGILPSNPAELLQSPLAQQLFSHFRNTPKFDYVIFDAPALLPIADAQILASYIQVTLLVADASKTPRRALVRAKQALSRTGTRVLGVTLNKSPWPDFSDNKDYQGNMQQRPRADITVAIPPSMANINRGIDATNTAILPSNKR